MPKGRAPHGPYEARVDFDRIDRDQDRRAAATTDELLRHFRIVERKTVVWVRENLAKKKLRLAVAKFSLPQQGSHREIIRRKMISAANRGADDVAEELDSDRTAFRTHELSRVRARADALMAEQVNWLETNLKKAWSQAMVGNIDKAQLEYVTRLVFAKFTGAPLPKAP